MLASVRNIPFLIWDGTNDELVPVAGPDRRRRRRSTISATATSSTSSRPGDHFPLAVNDQYAPAATFLGTAKVDRNPFHVTYVVNPRMDFADRRDRRGPRLLALGPAAPGRERARRRSGRSTRSRRRFGTRDPSPKPTQHTAGTLTGGNVGPLTYAETSKAWGPTRAAPKRDELDLTATNLSHAEVNVKRARLNCRAKLDVKTDGPLALRLAGCGRTLHFR